MGKVRQPTPRAFIHSPVDFVKDIARVENASMIP
jgi:hypothetical protein